MKGTIVVLGQDQNEEPIFGVAMEATGAIFPIIDALREVSVRQLNLRDEVVFMTQRGQEGVLIQSPRPKIGAERPRG
jgi:hypothetical protein